MRGAGRPGKGERGRVAERVRELIGPSPPEATGEEGSDPGRWLPDEELRADSPGGWAGESPDGWAVESVSSARGPAPAGARLSLARLRWEPDRRTALAVGLAVLAAAALTLWWVLSARPRDVAVHASGTGPVAGRSGQPTLSASSTPSTPSASSTPSSAGSGARGPSATSLVVDVAGKVRHPGVYRLVAGARVVNALSAAGGALPGVSTVSLNLAEPLRDGQQILVGVAGAVGSGGGVDPPGTEPSSSGSAGGLIDLNAATLEQLQTLPGVGPVLAQHILDWRTQHGRFTSVDQLNDVSGIGEVKFAGLRPLVTV